MWWMLPSALAAPAGNPIVDPALGRAQVGARIGAETAWEQDGGCGGQPDCDARWQRTLLGVTGQVNLLPGLALGGEISRSNERVREAEYTGQGFAGALDARAAVPVGGGWRAAAVGRLDLGRGTDPDETAADPSLDGQGAWRVGSASGLLAWGDPDDSIAVWGGAQAAWLWDHQLRPLGSGEGALNLPLQPALPASAVLGAALTSDDLGGLGAPSWRLTFAVEGLIGQSNGVSLGVSALF